MNILQISTADRGGGAEGSAWNLHRQFQQLGHHPVLAVGHRCSSEPDVIEIDRTPASPWARPLFALTQPLRPLSRRLRGLPSLIRALERLASPTRLHQFLTGRDETISPQGCRHLPQQLQTPPDIIQCHNLHGWYFDLEALPQLARHAPVVLNLRDTWALTGHCAYFLDCDRWQTGCGDCPRLNAYPRCLQDRTRENLQRKVELFSRSVAHLVTPSRWLKDCVAKSALAHLPCTVVPNGIETEIFTPLDGRPAARRRLGLPVSAPMVLFAAAPRASIFKDYHTLWTAAGALLQHMPEVHICCLGIAAPPDRELSRHPRLHCLPFVAERQKLADFYRAADVFWHAAKAEAFGKTVAEAMACATPVIATPVGGITDQLRDGYNGFGAVPENPDSFVKLTLQCLQLPEPQRQTLQQNAAKTGASFSLLRQAENFLKLFQEILDGR